MAKRAVRVSEQTHAFKKGDMLPLDIIYDVQGINDDWWEHLDGDPHSDAVVITRTVSIDITVKYYD